MVMPPLLGYSTVRSPFLGMESDVCSLPGKITNLTKVNEQLKIPHGDARVIRLYWEHSNFDPCTSLKKKHPYS